MTLKHFRQKPSQNAWKSKPRTERVIDFCSRYGFRIFMRHTFVNHKNIAVKRRLASRWKNATIPTARQFDTGWKIPVRFEFYKFIDFQIKIIDCAIFTGTRRYCTAYAPTTSRRWAQPPASSALSRTCTRSPKCTSTCSPTIAGLGVYRLFRFPEFPNFHDQFFRKSAPWRKRWRSKL